MAVLQTTDLEAAVTFKSREINFDAFREDLDPVARIDAVMAMISHCLAVPADFTNIVDDAAALVARTLNIGHFGVAWKRSDGKTTTFRVGEAATWEQDRKITDHNLSLETTKSASAYVMNTGHPLVIENFKTEDRFEDPVLARYGVQSAVVCPVAYRNQVYGTLGVYSNEPHKFVRDDVNLVGSIALQIATSVARERAEVALEEQKELMVAVMDYSTTIWLRISEAGRIEQFNVACEEITGFSLEEVKDRHFWSAFLIPEEVDCVKQAFKLLRKGQKSVTVETFVLTKQGDRKRVAWTFSALYENNESIRALIGSGVDVTATFEALENLECAQSAADDAKRALIDLRRQISDDKQGTGLSPGVVTGQPPELKKDRRVSRRASFLYHQIIAPLTNGNLPPLRDYKEVLCRDISSSGFSYYIEDPPKDHSEFVVAFGVPPKQTFLTAEVIHSSQTNYNGQKTYVVGCRYTGKANY